MSKKKFKLDKPIPLETIEILNKLYNNIISNEIILCETVKAELPKFDSPCYIPLEMVSSSLEVAYSEYKFEMIDIHSLWHLINWSLYKTVYTFDKDMYTELANSVDADNLSSSILTQLPYNSMYIDIKDDKILGYDGVYVTYNYNINEKYPTNELRFLFYSSNPDTTMYSIPITVRDGETIRESIENTVTEYNRIRGKVVDLKHQDNLNKIETFTKKSIPMVTQLLLYICSQNADIQENPTSQKIRKQSKSRNLATKWEVGYRVANNIRKYRNSTTAKAAHHNGSIKRPHVRKAHFHSFWVGKIGSDERKLIVKWVAPMFIHGDDEIPAVVNIISKEN